MYCRKCGKQIHDDSIFCEYCGEQIKKSNEAGIAANDSSFAAIERNKEIQASNINSSNSFNNYNTLSMKWFDFLKFLLPVWFGIGVLKEIIRISALYIKYGDIFYYTSVKLYLVLLLSYIIGVRVLQLYSYLLLKEYREKGIKMFLIFIILFSLSNLMEYVFTLVLSIEFGIFDSFSYNIFMTGLAAIIVMPILFIPNYIYFNKRKHLFK